MWLFSSFECSCGWSLGTEWKAHDIEEHVNGKHHNVFIYDRNHEEPRDSMATSLKQQIIETLSFDGKTVLDTTETGSPKGHLVIIVRLDNFPGQMTNPKLDFISRLHGAHLNATSAN